MPYHTTLHHITPHSPLRRLPPHPHRAPRHRLRRLRLRRAARQRAALRRHANPNSNPSIPIPIPSPNPNPYSTLTLTLTPTPTLTRHAAARLRRRRGARPSPRQPERHGLDGRHGRPTADLLIRLPTLGRRWRRVLSGGDADQQRRRRRRRCGRGGRGATDPRQGRGADHELLAVGR